ncbi:MAG: nitroreductase family protein [Clostridiaceae bacterium]
MNLGVGKMNETLKTIENRRSIRIYKTEQIKNEELNSILKAGNLAPSAMNQKLLHFSVVQSNELVKRINDFCKKALKRDQDKNLNLFYNAPSLVIVSAADNAIAPEIDAALALGNMFLVAQSLEVASCWIHAVRAISGSEEGKKLLEELKIPEGYSVVGSGIFGYAASPSYNPRKEGTVHIIK